MIVTDSDRLIRYRTVSVQGHTYSRLWHEYLLPALLFGSVGAITWAIRGTSGWGGIDGTVLSGMAWGILWFYYCYRIGLDARALVFWLGMGLALGGELGYGQYVSWIRGSFNLEDEVIAISPWYGYLWFVICGVGWGAPGGIVLGWALTKGGSRSLWLCRLGLLFVLIAIIVNLGASVLGSGLVESVGQWLASNAPGLLFPRADLGIYDGELGSHQGRTVYTNTQNGLVVLWWMVALALAAFQRDRKTLMMGAIIGGGFGIGFAVSAIWCLGYGYDPDLVDWWKLWELHAGFNLGVLYFVAMRWCICQTQDDELEPSAAQPSTTSAGHVLAIFVGAVLIFLSGYEYFFETGVFLTLLYIAVMLYAAMGPVGSATTRDSRIASVALIYSTFLLIFLLFHGGSSSAGILFGLYGPQDVDQYDWPTARIWIFAPIGILLTVAMVQWVWRTGRVGSRDGARWPGRLPLWMVDLIGFIGVIGAASIWPAKIGVLYAVSTGLSLYALTRINLYFDTIDRNGTDPTD